MAFDYVALRWGWETLSTQVTHPPALRFGSSTGIWLYKWPIPSRGATINAIFAGEQRFLSPPRPYVCVFFQVSAETQSFDTGFWFGAVVMSQSILCF